MHSSILQVLTLIPEKNISVLRIFFPKIVLGHGPKKWLIYFVQHGKFPGDGPKNSRIRVKGFIGFCPKIILSKNFENDFKKNCFKCSN